MSAAQPESVGAVLEDARTLGFLGPGPVEVHIEHAHGFAAAAERGAAGEPGRFCDLGSGGGVPALVLAELWPAASALLVDSSQRRTAFLSAAVDRLGWGDRIEVREARAETVAHDPGLREAFPLVTARSFGEPAVVAEIAAGLVAVAGILVVSEPPEPDGSRWPAAGLEELGFGPAVVTTGGNRRFAVIPKTRPADSGVPGDRTSGETPPLDAFHVKH